MRPTRGAFMLLLGLTSWVVVAFPGTAFAHARLMSCSPAAGAHVGAEVPAVVLRFDDTVTLVPAAVVVTSHAGGRVATGRPRVIGHKTLVAAMRRRLPPGGYRVSWRVLADDGHIEAGRFGFTVVGAGGAAPADALTPVPAAPAQPVWPVVVASALAVVAGLAAFVVVRRGMSAARAVPDAYPAAPTTRALGRSPTTAHDHGAERRRR